VHKFSINGKRIMCDVNTCCVCEIDEVTSDIVDVVCNNITDSNIEKLYQKHGKDSVNEALKELEELRNQGILSSSDLNEFNQPVHPVTTMICMNISHSCDLDCNYCYADGGSYFQKEKMMDKSTAEKSIDYLIENSGEEKSLSVSFFGGEPLLNYSVLKHSVEYAKSQGKLHDKKFKFHVTTNGLHLTKDIQDFLNKENFSIIVSFDGPKRIHNKHRPFKNGKGSYDKIIENAIEFLETRDPYGITIRGTFTGSSHKIGKMMMHPVKFGFRRISVEPCMLPHDHKHAIKPKDVPRIKKSYNEAAKTYLKNLSEGNLFEFFHFFNVMDGITYPSTQYTQCGASRGYVGISPTGDIYPCHGLINTEGYKIGNVHNGVFNKDIQKEFHSANVQGKEKCKSCWARYFCGGGCHAHAIKYGEGIFEPYDIECQLYKHRLKLGMWIYTTLAKDRPEVLEKLFHDGRKISKKTSESTDCIDDSSSEIKKKP
jgi:uncharacterized protein